MCECMRRPWARWKSRHLTNVESLTVYGACGQIAYLDDVSGDSVAESYCKSPYFIVLQP